MITDLLFFHGAITRFIWVLLVCLVVVMACGMLWIVWGFIVERVEAACMGKWSVRMSSSQPDKNGRAPWQR